MRISVFVLCFALTAQAQAPAPTKIMNAAGTLSAGVQSTATTGTEAGLVVRVAGTVATTGGGGPSDVNLIKVNGVAFALGSRPMAESLSFTWASDLTPLAAVQSGAWTTGRTWTLSSGTDSVTVAGTLAATQSGAWSTGRTWALSSGADSVTIVPSGTQAVSGTFFQATQPVSIAGTVAVSGPLTDAQLRAVPVPVSGTVATGGLTDAQLRASAVPVSGTVTANLGTIGSAATAAKQDTGNTSLSSIDSKIPSSPATTGKQDTGNTSLASIDLKLILPAALDATGGVKVHEQGTVPVTGTFFQATQPVSGTFFQATQPISAAALPLPALAATSTLQTTGNTSLANLDVLLSTRTKPADQQHAIVDSGTTTVTQATGTNLHMVVDSAPTTAVTGTFFQATQPVSGTVSATQGTSPWVVSGTVDPTTPPTIGSDVQAVTGTALALPSHAAKRVCVTHKPGGAQTYIYFGDSGATAGASGKGTTLSAGQAACFPQANTNTIYVISDGVGSYVNFAWVN